MVLAPSIALFSAGSRVAGLEPRWTVKPLAEVPVASGASLVAASDVYKRQSIVRATQDCKFGNDMLPFCNELAIALNR